MTTPPLPDSHSANRMTCAGVVPSFVTLANGERWQPVPVGWVLLDAAEFSLLKDEHFASYSEVIALQEQRNEGRCL